MTVGGGCGGWLVGSSATRRNACLSRRPCHRLVSLPQFFFSPEPIHVWRSVEASSLNPKLVRQGFNFFLVWIGGYCFRRPASPYNFFSSHSTSSVATYVLGCNHGTNRPGSTTASVPSSAEIGKRTGDPPSRKCLNFIMNNAPAERWWFWRRALQRTWKQWPTDGQPVFDRPCSRLSLVPFIG
jgi:hypothetical protein